MKVIVDIPEDVIEATKNGSANIYNLCGYLMNGKTLESCEDAISRNVVLDTITRIGLSKYDTNEVRTANEYFKAVKSLPPVMPQPKVGHWIRWYEQKETERGIEHIPHCKCSECGKEYDPHSSQFIRFCSNCGIKMEEEK